MTLPECEQFEGRLKAIYRGEAGIPLDGDHGTNAYRKLWNLPPLVSTSTSPDQPLAIEEATPSLLIRGWNFAAAMTRWTLAGMPRRTQAEIDERLAICQACPHLHNNHCIKCGCACVEQNRLMNKLALSTEKCPEGKWE
jgi:hypothetical protein